MVMEQGISEPAKKWLENGSGTGHISLKTALEQGISEPAKSGLKTVLEQVM